MRAFISYSHSDKAALDRLHVHLKNLTREGRIETWYDRNILAGGELDAEIERELEASDLFLLLVSPDFIASDYCVEREMRRRRDRPCSADHRGGMRLESDEGVAPTEGRADGRQGDQRLGQSKHRLPKCRAGTSTHHRR